MWGRHARVRREIGGAALEIERAGAAWACRFASAQEFEAAIVRARRDAGAWGPRRNRRRAAAAAAALIVVLVAGALLAVALGRAF